MKILRQNQSKKWVPIEKKYYSDEAQLQNLLVDDVNILPLTDIGYEGPFVTIGKEVGLPNGALDVLAVSPQGHIVLIETKLDKNPEVKRTVVGQILGYAAYLWNNSYKEFEDNYFKKFISTQNIKFSGSLSDYVKEKCGNDNFSEVDFKEGIEKRLRFGSFTLLIVVDQINQELKDIANYLNDRTGQEIDFYLVELELIGDKKEQFLIPRLANPPHKTIVQDTGKTNDNYDRTPISKDEFLQKLSPKACKIAEELLNEFESSENVVTTWRKNGFSLMTKLPKKSISTGTYNNFSYLFFRVSPNPDIKEEIGFEYPEGIYTKFPENHKYVSEYVKYYRSLKGYNNKSINNFSDFDVKKLIDFINKTAKNLKKADN